LDIKNLRDSNRARLPLVLLAIFVFSTACLNSDVEFIVQSNRIDILIGGEHVTSYLHSIDSTSSMVDRELRLTKPILYPVYSPSGVIVCRGYPLDRIEGESTDHPHHTGLFFAYNDINEEGGFWENSKNEMPVIKHVKTLHINRRDGMGELSVLKQWVGKSGSVLLEETREMVFTGGKDETIIDFSINLKATEKTVTFRDTKEGLFAIRVADWLREEGGTGIYLNSNGKKKEKNVWGKRARWMRLQGVKNGRIIGIAIFYHPKSINYPTYWMVRGYGLFSANPLGQYIYQKHHGQKNPQRLDLTLKPGEVAHFIFRMVIYEGSRTSEQLEGIFKDFAK